MVKGFRKYGLDIVGLSETRWNEFRELRSSTGEYILYSGSEDDQQRGVGMTLKKETRVALLRWNPVNDRILSARSNSRYAKLTIVLF